MQIIHTAFFYIIALIAILSALVVVFSPSIIYSAVSLLVTFLSIAGIFILLNADFVGIAQIVIYAVGIAIVLIFAIMLTGREEDRNLWIAFAPRTLFSLVISFVMFVLIVFSITGGLKNFAEKTNIFAVKQPPVETVEQIKQEGATAIIGKQLLTSYVLPFEVLSLLLLAAIFGAVVIARKDTDKLVNPTTPEIIENEGEEI